jgi:putative membrane protein
MRPWLTEDELGRLEAAVRDAERGTTAEIVVVVAGGPAAAGASWLLWPALAALAAPLPALLLWPALPARVLHALQLAVLALGLLPSLVPDLRRLLTPAAIRRDWTRRLARDQFFELGLQRTAARTGVLLLVSPADRFAEVVADAGAEGPFPDEAWRPCLDALLAEARHGRLAAGIEAALGALGAVLRERAPAGPGDRDEVPNRPVLL